MTLSGRARPSALDGAYLAVGLVAAVGFRKLSVLWFAAVGFALAVLVVDWLELRRRAAREHRGPLALTMTTLAMLAVWVGLPVVAASNLRLYFAVAGGVFCLQAIREVAVFARGPIELLRGGYPNLVGVCLVCSVLADALVQYRLGLLAILAGTYAVRKAFLWRSLPGQSQ